MGHFFWSSEKSYVISFLLRLLFIFLHCQLFVLIQPRELRFKQVSSIIQVGMTSTVHLKDVFQSQEIVSTFFSRPESYVLFSLCD